MANFLHGIYHLVDDNTNIAGKALQSNGDISSYVTMNECDTGKIDFLDWPSNIKLTLLDNIGMYLDGDKVDIGRKRKTSWHNEGLNEKLLRSTDRMDEILDIKDQRKGPTKKSIGVNEMGVGSAGSTGSSHLSPSWQVNDIDLDLAGDLNMNEALVNIPSLTVFKQETPSPPGAEPRRGWHSRHRQQMDGVCIETGRDMQDTNMQTNHGTQNNSPVTVHQGGDHSMMTQQYLTHSMMSDNKGTSNAGGLLMCTDSMDYIGQSHHQRSIVSSTDSSFKDDLRFQYVLAAATSIATKTTEETLTYLNQGQSYEIKLKKLGDLSHYKGKILKSIVKICFHERRLQYMEKEQMAQWHKERPGQRIVEVDVPLSYGLIQVSQPSQALNTVELLWDPTKDVGVYIKVNCISTEFTAKKHGGEKGVPFRIQVETYLAGGHDDSRLHAAACQIKVFKLKGADRKHKQDREKVLRRSQSEMEMFQPSCDCTVLTNLPNDAILPPPSIITTSPSLSPDICATGAKTSPGVVSPKQSFTQTGIVGTATSLKSDFGADSELKVITPPCYSPPGAILPDLPIRAQDENDKCLGLPKEATALDTQVWLQRNRFTQYESTFANFSGADLLRLSRDDLIQICGLADGIRLYNALHAKRMEPKAVLYVRIGNDNVHTAIYLHVGTSAELTSKLYSLTAVTPKQEPDSVLLCGPGGAKVLLTDEVVRHLPQHATYSLQINESGTLILMPNTQPT